MRKAGCAAWKTKKPQDLVLRFFYAFNCRSLIIQQRLCQLRLCQQLCCRSECQQLRCQLQLCQRRQPELFCYHKMRMK